MTVLANLNNPPATGDDRNQDREGDIAVSMQAALMCTGPISKVDTEFEGYWREFYRWLNDAGHDNAVRGLKRRMLLSVCQGQVYNDDLPKPADFYRLLDLVWANRPR